jgi:ABC-type bacteriocin/lantibiotic exporter with double-glycine peptidase domain
MTGDVSKRTADLPEHAFRVLNSLITNLIPNLVSVVWIYFSFSKLSAPFVRIFFLWVVIEVIMYLYGLPHYLKKNEVHAVSNNKISAVITDILQNISLVKTSYAYDHESKYFSTYQNTEKVAQTKAHMYFALFNSARMIIFAVVRLMFLMLCAYLFIQDKNTIADVVCTIHLVSNLEDVLYYGSITLNDIMVEIGRIKIALQAFQNPTMKALPRTKNTIQNGDIKFENISFKYQ